MKLDEKMQLYEAAISKFGMRDQLDIVKEEAAELIDVISKWQRGRRTLANVAEEMADVTIMIEQLRVMLALDGEFHYAYDKKLTRLAKRLGFINQVQNCKED